MQPRRLITRGVAPTVLLVCVIGLWEALVKINDVPAYLFPAPTDVGHEFLHRHELLAASVVTGREIVIGYLAAVLAALGFAVAMHASKLCRQAFYPLLVVSQTVPTVLLAPILVVAFGFGLTPKLIVIALVCFFPIVVNAYDGLQSADADRVRMLMSLHGTPWLRFRKLDVPMALPAAFSGARVAATYAAVAAVFAEWTGSQAGLGFVILQAGPSLETATIVAAVLILAVMALALSGVVSALQRLLSPWSTEVRHA